MAVLEVPDVLRHGQGARPGRPRLRDLPIIREEFGAGRLSYAKVRALTRIATPETEAGLAELAGPMTGNQLERFARAHRQASPATEAAARIRRRLVWRFDEDGYRGLSAAQGVRQGDRQRLPAVRDRKL